MNPPPLAAWDRDRLAEAVETGVGPRRLRHRIRRLGGRGEPGLRENALHNLELDAAYDMLQAGARRTPHCFVHRFDMPSWVIEGTVELMLQRRELRASTIGATDPEQVETLKALHRQVRRARKAYWRRHRARLVCQLAEAWRRKMALCWQIARRLAGRRQGTRNRQYWRPPAHRPSVADWERYSALPPSEGGCVATRAPPSTPLRQVHSRTDAVELAMEDYEGLRAHLRRATLRRAVPEWSVPVEVWRMLDFPTAVRTRRDLRFGVGHSWLVGIPLFGRMLFQLLVTVRMVDAPPLPWNRSQATFLEKLGSKHGCAGQRPIALLDPVGKFYHKHLWSRGGGPAAADRPWAAGYSKHGCREHAILQQKAVAARRASRFREFATPFATLAIVAPFRARQQRSASSAFGPLVSDSTPFAVCGRMLLASSLRLRLRLCALHRLCLDWETVCPLAQDTKKMEAVLAGYARSLLRGKAGGKRETEQEDGGVKVEYRSLSNKEVYKRIGMCDLETELRMRRLGFWQGVFSRISLYDALLGAVFGEWEGFPPSLTRRDSS